MYDRYDYDWCLAQKCKYSSPILLRVNGFSKNGIYVIEYGFGEYNYEIDESKIMCYGDRKTLASHLSSYEQVKALSDKIKETMQ